MGRIRYADSDLDDMAGILAASHPYAAQYLEQAPVLTILAAGKFGRHLTYGEVDRFKSQVEAGARLKDMLHRYGGSAPSRRLTPTQLRADDRAAVRQVLLLDPSTQSQVIPQERDQRVWLDGMRQWLRLTPNSSAAKAKTFNVAWVARQLCEDVNRFPMLETIIDFVGRGGGAINERWSWSKALQEVDRWHERLNDRWTNQQRLRDAAAMEAFNAVICKAPLPDKVSSDGYDFEVLRTARRLQEEGSAMHHCVSSYAGLVQNGACAIVSIRREGVRVATLEVLASGSIGQLKGHCNRAVDQTVRSACDMYVLRNWNAKVAA